jgi:pyrroline-5-carboxylate reductase
MKMTIAIIGAGNIGQSIAKGLLASNLKIDKMYLTRRNTDSIQHFKSENIIITSDNDEAILNSELIFLCIQPQQFDSISKQLKSSFYNCNKTLVSIVAAKEISQLEKVVGKKLKIVRAMPNTAISIAKSITCFCLNKQGEKHLIEIEKILNNLGETLYVREELLQASTVICASGIAFWMRMIRATMQGAIQLGFESDEALKISVQTCLGAASILEKSNTHPETEIDKVTTPNGCTITGLNEMEHLGLNSVIIKGMMASYKHLNDIKLKTN